MLHEIAKTFNQNFNVEMSRFNLAIIIPAQTFDFTSQLHNSLC